MLIEVHLFVYHLGIITPCLNYLCPHLFSKNLDYQKFNQWGISYEYRAILEYLLRVSGIG